jgi:hypothetical protein
MTFLAKQFNLKNAIFIVISIIFLFYLVSPNLSFPESPPDTLQSKEPADIEDSYRRAYFTNLDRKQVLDYYQKQFKLHLFLWDIPSYRLNYPPEDAQTIIRDQTRSTFLEEIIYPMRDSIFVNGFEPKEEKDAIFIEGKYWRQKIIIKYVHSYTVARVIIGLGALLVLYYLLTEWIKGLKKFYKLTKKLF